MRVDLCREDIPPLAYELKWKALRELVRLDVIIKAATLDWIEHAIEDGIIRCAKQGGIRGTYCIEVTKIKETGPNQSDFNIRVMAYAPGKQTGRCVRFWDRVYAKSA